MVQGGMSCIKYLLFVFNFIFVVCGIALISVGAIVQSTGRDYTIFLESKYLTAPTILIAVGCLIFLLAFLGCCGAVKENHCMVMTFGILLFIIFVIEIAGGITAYVYRNKVEEFLKDRMFETLRQDKKDFRKGWDEMQMKLHCCGVDDANDWDHTNDTYPDSCCGNGANTDGGYSCKKPYDKGCYETLKMKLKDDIALVGGVGIGIAVVELIGVMFAWCLASAIKKEYEGV